jgi:hypothetical protein
MHLDPVDFSPLHPEPESLLNRRITFPDATGTVITTGNSDDVVFEKLILRGMALDGYAYFGGIKNKFNPAVFDSDAPVLITWTKSNFVSGGINFLGSNNFRDVSAGLAYAAPSTILQKPSGSTQDIVDYQVRTVSVCVFDLIIGKAGPELCPFQSGQDSCPRQGPKAPANTSFCPVRQPASMCSRDNVLVDDCFTDAQCGDAQKCKTSRVCLTGNYNGEPCSTDMNCCKDQTTTCKHKCHGGWPKLCNLCCMV